MVSSSQQQETLFEMIRNCTDNSVVIETIKKLHEQGNNLSWFQSFIPGLVPGNDDSQKWLEEARLLLWEANDHVEHEEISHRKSRMRSRSPMSLPTDRFGLRRYWPVFIELLRPLSSEMERRVNAVSYALGLAACAREQELMEPEEFVTKDNFFVISRQAVQDKVLSPIIKELEGIITQAWNGPDNTEAIGFAETLSRHKAATHRLETAYDDSEISKNMQIRQTLIDLRALIVDEKNMVSKPKQQAKRRRDTQGICELQDI